jgi:hypothetical protein
MPNGKYLFPGHKEPLTRKQWLECDTDKEQVIDRSAIRAIVSRSKLKRYPELEDITMEVSKPFAVVKPLTKGVRKEIIATLSKGKGR